MLLRDGEYGSGTSIDLVSLLEEYIADTPEEDDIPTDGSPYAALTEYFRCCERKSLTIHFIETEDLLDMELPWEAYKFQTFWRETSFDVDAGKRSDLWEQEGYPIHAIELSLPDHCIADSWLKYEYKISSLDLEKKKVSFRRGAALRGTAGRTLRKVQQIERALMGQKLSHKAVKEIEFSLDSMIEKYRL